MISKAQRTKLKKLLKRSFIPDVQYILREKNVVNKKGFEFSISYISQVFGGLESNKDIEDAIFEVYQNKKTELANLQTERNKRL